MVCVRRNAQLRELKLSKSTRFVLNTVLMVAVSTCGPTGVSPPPLSSQNIQSHKKSPQAAGSRVKHKPRVFRWALIVGKASRIQSGRIGSALVVCVRRNVQHRELKLPKSTRFVLNAVAMIAVSTCGPTGVVTPPLSSQNIQTHEK